MTQREVNEGKNGEYIIGIVIHSKKKSALNSFITHSRRNKAVSIYVLSEQQFLQFFFCFLILCLEFDGRSDGLLHTRSFHSQPHRSVRFLALSAVHFCTEPNGPNCIGQLGLISIDIQYGF